ncbi:MAG: HEPN domain-containing protein [Bacillota bacterium]|nr:HEPN domain-containing protein [Bacillota bacterium]
MGDKGLLEIAKRDLIMIRSVMVDFSGDDILLNLVAYHCQQAIEKICKYSISLKGKRYLRTHRVQDLLELMDEFEISYPKDLEMLAPSISVWATEARYNSNKCANLKIVKKVIKIIEEWIVEIEPQKRN